jgi:hypothetical protein
MGGYKKCFSTLPEKMAAQFSRIRLSCASPLGHVNMWVVTVVQFHSAIEQQRV